MEVSATATLIASREKQRSRRSVIFGFLGLLILVVWPLLVSSNYFIYIGTMIVLNSIGAIALHLIIRMGQMSLGQAAFLGIGAYTSAILTLRLGVPFPLAFILSGLFAAIFGALIGPIVLRLKGVYFVLVTFTFGEIMRLIFNEWTSLTGGPEGIDKIPPPFPSMITTDNFYYIALGTAIVCILFVVRLLKCPFGHAVDAIRESEILAAATGVPVVKYKLTVFVIACGLVGFQGCLQAHFVHYISPLAFEFSQSLNFVVINVIGGMNSLIGPLIGTLFIVSLPEMLRGWVEYQYIIYGLVLIGVMTYKPGGLAEIVEQIYGAIISRRAK